MSRHSEGPGLREKIEQQEVVFSLTKTYCRVTTVEDAAPVRCTRCFYTFGAAENAVFGDFDGEGEEWMCLPCAALVGELCLESVSPPVPSADTEPELPRLFDDALDHIEALLTDRLSGLPDGFARAFLAELGRPVPADTEIGDKADG